LAVFVMSTFLLCLLSLIAYLCYFVFFFFSSRRRHTRFKCDWSSDVCSSDLSTASTSIVALSVSISAITSPDLTVSPSFTNHFERSEERRVGKEWISHWAAGY